jgi:hypothetical protein
MDLPEALEQLKNATHSLKLFLSWVESQTEEQLRDMSNDNWMALYSAGHDHEERAIELDRELTRGKEARPT